MNVLDPLPLRRTVVWQAVLSAGLLLTLAAGCSDLGTNPIPPEAGVPTAVTPSSVTDSSFTARWSAVGGATGYRLDVSQDSLFGSFLPGYEDRDAGTATSFVITGLAVNARYFYRVRAVTANGSSAYSNVVGVTVHAGAPQLSFSRDVYPLLVQYGCTGCHGGTNGLTVATVADLLRGGNHGPAIVPGDGAGSLIVRKISPTPPFGSRMPQGGPYMSDANIGIIRTWIDQGAPDN